MDRWCGAPHSSTVRAIRRGSGASGASSGRAGARGDGAAGLRPRRRVCRARLSGFARGGGGGAGRARSARARRLRTFLGRCLDRGPGARRRRALRTGVDVRRDAPESQLPRACAARCDRAAGLCGARPLRPERRLRARTGGRAARDGGGRWSRVRSGGARERGATARTRPTYPATCCGVASATGSSRSGSSRT